MPTSFGSGGKGDPFHVSYKYVLNNDIRYMYSGYPLRYTGRREPDYPNFDMLRLARENSNLKRKTLRVSRYGEQDPFMLPRAPAFRDVQRNNVDKIVNRLIQPTYSRMEHMPLNVKSTLGKTSEDRRCVTQLRDPIQREAYPSYRSMSPEDMKKVSSRLYNTHTHMSQLKRRDFDEVRATLPILKDSPDPDRMRCPPHPMHTHPWDVSGMPIVDV